jgi:predicted O-methyltransferase YrrM
MRSILLSKIFRVWANPWGADPAVLESVMRWLDESSGPALECGSGVSTLALAAGVSSTPRRLVSLEHRTEWAERVRKAVPTGMRADLDIIVRPLVDHGEYDWYDVDTTSLPDAIGFVFCDGPPGKTRGGRLGVQRILQERAAPGAVVVFDDTSRPREREILQQCCADLPADLVEDTPTHSAIRVAG